jgi:hypothetical protein
MTSEYITLQKIRRSGIYNQPLPFIGRAFPVKTEEEALAHLAALRKQHYDATHNCYAYRIGETAAIARFSDDGEPTGNGGPMMEALRAKGQPLPRRSHPLFRRYLAGRRRPCARLFKGGLGSGRQSGLQPCVFAMPIP